MARGLEGKLDQDEWPMLKESVIRAAHQQCMMHLLLQLQQQQQQQQKQQDAHGASTAAGCDAHERLGNASRRAAPPLHAWPSAARGAPSSGGAAGGGEGGGAAARINGGDALVETHRLVESQFGIVGGDGRVYRGASSELKKEFVCASSGFGGGGGCGVGASPAGVGGCARRRRLYTPSHAPILRGVRRAAEHRAAHLLSP